jgi:hypothetical protein
MAISKQTKGAKMKKNPFTIGSCVSPDQLINRSVEIKDAISLLRSGQSLAFTGYPRSGKTSLLLYLQDRTLREQLFEDDAYRTHFFFLDFQPISSNFTRSDFWHLVMTAYVKKIKKADPKSSLLSIYTSCKKNNYETIYLDSFFKDSISEGWHLILLLDEFDTVLQHASLNNNEFLGGLRSLASRYGSALSLVISSQSTLSTLNEETSKTSPKGSPYFNFIKEIPILPFSRKHANDILNLSSRKFRQEEKNYLLEIAGFHPYLLQAGGSALWNAYENNYPPQERLVIVGNAIVRIASSQLNRIWDHWSPKTRKIFTCIALDEMPSLLGSSQFDIEEMRKIVANQSGELRYLIERGFIMPDPLLPSGYCVTAKVMLWWLAEQLLFSIDNQDEVGAFLFKNQLDGLFTRNEQAQFASAIDRLKEVVFGGVEIFVKTAAEGFGKGLSSTSNNV